MNSSSDTKMNSSSDTKRPKMAMQTTQSFDDAFPNMNTSLLLSQILEEQVETNQLLVRIAKLLEEEPT